MRRPVDAERIRRFMRELGGEAERDVRLYFTGGATAVLLGWRTGTIDVDVKLEPETDRLFRAFPRLKEKLEINIELASPDQFIPELPGWRDRSAFIAQEGRLAFYHYDFHSQALSKIQRGHAQDRDDVRQMIDRGLIDRQELRRRFEEIEPHLYRFPAIDPAAFRRAVAEALEIDAPET
ncbi:MAG TPA: DUF6036 family nucleotidyltransferase [Thermoanaerobaculia bacterium]|jgi:hypothetical protein|nr:DUF6036 family nucleotidyltransferase [Thermoanaerobaculia bacterium]